MPWQAFFQQQSCQASFWGFRILHSGRQCAMPIILDMKQKIRNLQQFSRVTKKKLFRLAGMGWILCICPVIGFRPAFGKRQPFLGSVITLARSYDAEGGREMHSWLKGEKIKQLFCTVQSVMHSWLKSEKIKQLFCTIQNYAILKNKKKEYHEK